jgi:hypothetical protein
MEKILRINMGPDSEPKTTEEPLGDYSGLGGRAMTSAMGKQQTGHCPRVVEWNRCGHVRSNLRRL